MVVGGGGEGRADATPAPLSLQPCIETPKRRTLVINEIRTNTDEIYDLHEYVQSLATEMEAMKWFIKEQFYLLKKLYWRDSQ